jgi:hypothetical protein
MITIISKEEAIKLIEFYLKDIELKITSIKALIKDYRKELKHALQPYVILLWIDDEKLKLKELRKEKRKYERMLNKIKEIIYE